jgi:hypothetical protein
MSLRRTLSSLVTITALALVSTGCAHQPAASTPGTPVYTDYQDMDAEFQTAKQTLQLPSGVDWPAHAEYQPDAQYERYYGQTQGELYWLCAWEKELVSASGQDARRHDEAMRQLEQLRKTRLYQHSAEPKLRRLMSDSLDAAQKGDISLIQQDVAVNCTS